MLCAPPPGGDRFRGAEERGQGGRGAAAPSSPPLWAARSGGLGTWGGEQVYVYAGTPGGERRGEAALRKVVKGARERGVQGAGGGR